MARTRLTVATAAVTAATMIGLTQSVTPQQADTTHAGRSQQAVSQAADAQERERERMLAAGAAHADAENARRLTPSEQRRAERALTGLFRRRLP